MSVAPVFRGDTSIKEQPGSPRWQFGEYTRVFLRYRG
jgi:hypothetical protein